MGVSQKQFRSPANGHARTRNGRGGRWVRKLSKLGRLLTADRLEQLLRQARRQGKAIQ